MTDRDYNTRNEIEHVKAILREQETRRVDLGMDSRIRRYIGPSEKDIRMRKLLMQDLRADTFPYRMIFGGGFETNDTEIPGLEPFKYIVSGVLDREWFIDNCVDGRVGKGDNQISMF